MSLFSDTKEYLKLQIDYLKIRSLEKLTILISTLILGMVVLILSAGALFYMFFSLAYALAPVVGGLAVSYGIITLVYLILILLLFLFRKKLIVNPTLNLLTKLFEEEESEEKELVKQDGKDQ